MTCSERILISIGKAITGPAQAAEFTDLQSVEDCHILQYWRTAGQQLRFGRAFLASIRNNVCNQ
jgi:hypothetical protein